MGEESNKAELWSLLEKQGGHVYVCGGTAMGADVGKVGWLVGDEN
jgi:sulfite reductase alpha subunit-like flavoprotein